MDKLIKLRKLNAQLKRVNEREMELRSKISTIQSKRLKLETDIHYLKESMQPDFGPRLTFE